MAYALIVLNDRDRNALRKTDYLSGGFQSLHETLQAAWHQAGSRAILPIETASVAERVWRYAYDYGNGGWQSRLRGWCAQLPPRGQCERDAGIGKQRNLFGEGV